MYKQHTVREILKSILIFYILQIMTYFKFCCHFD